LSPSRTSHLVQELLGKSLQELVIDERLAAAQRLLADTDLAVAEIGTRVGWPDPPHFARIFRRQTALSPAAWRSQHRRV
jgi:AraC-like DNA-binding protein